MFIITADLPSKPHQVIERNISISRTSSEDELRYEANEREFLNQQLVLIGMDCYQMYGQGSGRSSVYNNALKEAITKYLQRVGTPVALKMLEESKAMWKKNKL